MLASQRVETMGSCVAVFQLFYLHLVLNLENNNPLFPDASLVMLLSLLLCNS